MFERIIRIAVELRWLVLLAVLGMAGLGIYSYQELPIDAVPDITNVQVQVNTAAPGYSPLETEQRITYPIETAMAGLPQLEQTRSVSRYGLSQVSVIFKEGTDIYFARQLVNQRIQEAKDSLPANVSTTLGPISTGLGEIYLWTVKASVEAKKADGTAYTSTDLREIQDWIIKPQLRNVPGVTEVNSIGGYTKEYEVAPSPEKLAAYGLTLADVVAALERNNSNVGAGYIEKQGEQLLIRLPGQVVGLSDIGNIALATIQGVTVRMRDIGTIDIGRELRNGAATENGAEVVLGTVFMLIGQNSHAVSQAVDKKLAEINHTLPHGVQATPVYDRTVLVDKAIHTVKQNLLEGAVLVIAVLFLLLGNLRAALITALVIPLAMLFTFTGMVHYKISANLLSLGALDFGIIVDGAVVIVENCVRRLAYAQSLKGRPLDRAERLREVFRASNEAKRPLLFGQLIIIIVYLPIFALTGVEGKMFHPMAFTVVVALVGAMILSITFIPAAVALFIGTKVTESENLLMKTARRAYVPLLNKSLRNKPVVLTGVGIIVVLCALLTTRLGSEFIPSMNEGDFAILALRIPGTSLSQAIVMQKQVETTLKQGFPEVERVFTRIGTAEVATDAQGPNISDGYIMLKPEAQWPTPRRTRQELLAAMQAAVAKIPGSNYEFSQPIQLRFNELISGVRSDVAVKVFGDDMAVLNDVAAKVATVLEKTSGAADVKVEQTAGLPMLTIDVDRNKIASYGVSLADVQETVSTAINGKSAGIVFQGDRRFNLVVRLPENVRGDLDALRRLPVALPKSGAADGKTSFVPLAAVANLNLASGPNQISREDGKRLIVVSANVRGRDIGSFVSESQLAIAQQVTVPAGYWVRWGGRFEQLQSALGTIKIIVPVALLLVLALLYLMFGNVTDGLLVFSGIPFALTGGVVALWARGIPISISAAVGFIALSGVAVLNGLVMVAFIRSLREGGAHIDTAVEEGAVARLRPVLMTALVASLGFIPMAIATGTGAEVQRPLATVVIGGILSSTALTLLVLPLLYRMFHSVREDEFDLIPRNTTLHRTGDDQHHIDPAGTINAVAHDNERIV